MKALRDLSGRAIEAAASLTGKRFSLLVASSLVATSTIVAVAMTGSNGLGPLAGVLGRSLAADRTAPVAATPEPAPEATETSTAPEVAESPSPAPSPAPEAPSNEPAPTPQATETSTPEAPATPEPPAPEAGQIKHVFLISLASPGYDAAFGAASQMPYLNGTLRPEGDLLSNFSLLDKTALPNSVAAISGQPPNAATKADCPEYGKCVFSAETLTLADQLGIAQFNWRGYMEGMVDPTTAEPANCVYPQPGAPETTTAGAYAPQLNPFVYFHSLLDLGDCASSDVPLTAFEKDLKMVDSTPNFAYISPTPCNAGVPGQCPAGSPEGASAADAFLAAWVPKILSSPAYKKDGLLIVTFGQAAPAPGAAPPPKPLKVGSLLVSQFITAGSTDGVAYNPYSLLKSTEDLFGLGYLEKARPAKVRSFGMALRGSEGAGD